jgi:hypothetical protein
VGDITNSKLVSTVMRFKYNSKLNKFEAQRPGIFMKNPVRVSKGSYVPVISPGSNAQ